MRSIIMLNDNWNFIRIDKAVLSENEVVCADLDDSSWEKVCLPHTYNSSDCLNSDYYRGTTCYRRRLWLTSEQYKDKELFLEFGGANNTAQVYVNNIFAGKHEGGYSAFRVNITKHIRFDNENLICVLVSNSPSSYIAPISEQGDFTKMGGLYRAVKLIAADPVHIALEDDGSGGVYITPHDITDSSAVIDILIKLDSADNTTAKAVIFSPNGEPITELSEHSQSDRLILSGRITDPQLWNGVESPCLYRAEVTLFHNSEAVDKVAELFGIRTYHIDTENGFFLNGKPYQLHGVNYHQDSFENGWAMTDIQRERDYGIIRDMGCTAVRMAHYQHCSQEYSLCDKLGICVWTEIGIVNKMSTDESDDHFLAEGFAKNAKQQLRELIKQNYNHPSIIVWGLSNELHQMSDRIFELYSELYSIAHSEDPTRLKTYADNQFYGRFLELPADVVGYNRYFGWYKEAGDAENFGEWLDLYHSRKEKRPVCISEYGGGGAISQHKDNIDWHNDIDPNGVRHYENYQSQLHETVWRQFSKRKYLWAVFIWCMFDFASAGRLEGDTKGQNDKGLATRERVPKDVYFFYRSVWSKEKMIYITERRHRVRPCDVPYVKVYSNAQSVELILNDRSLGKIYSSELPDDADTIFVWNNVHLGKGMNNTLVSKAFFADGTIKFDKVIWIGE